MFSKKEFSFVTIVLTVIAVVTVVNLFASYRKSRDVSRKNELGDIESRLTDFKKAIGTFPLATEDGKMIGCNGFKNKQGDWVFAPCEWGDNKINSPFFDPLPRDPYFDKGRKFVYRSNGDNFQIYAALEGSYEDEYDKNIVLMKISCGDVDCNAGRTSGARPVLYDPLPSPSPTPRK